MQLEYQRTFQFNSCLINNNEKRSCLVLHAVRSLGCLIQSPKSYLTDHEYGRFNWPIQRVVFYSTPSFLLLDSMIWRCNKFFLSSVCLSRSGVFTPEKNVAVTSSSPGQRDSDTVKGVHQSNWKRLQLMRPFCNGRKAVTFSTAA